MSSVMPEKLKELLDDVKSVYESKGMTVYPNSFSKLETEIVKVCNTKDNLEKENAELTATNKSLLESCEGATMMYKDLCKAKELINTLLLIADNKVSQLEFQLCIADAIQFLKERK